MAAPPSVLELRAAMQALIRRFGLLAETSTPCGHPLATSHAHALMILAESGPDGLPQGELARRLGIDKSNGSRLVQKLAEEGRVSVRGADEDARVRRVRLTARGERLAGEVERASRARFASVYAAIPARHRRAVLAGLSHLVRAMERNEP